MQLFTSKGKTFCIHNILFSRAEPGWSITLWLRESLPVLRSTPVSCPDSTCSAWTFTSVSWGSYPEFWASTWHRTEGLASFCWLQSPPAERVESVCAWKPLYPPGTLFTLGMMSRASAKAWTPSWALPFTLGLCFTRALATATSSAPAPGTTHPAREKDLFQFKQLIFSAVWSLPSTSCTWTGEYLHRYQAQNYKITSHWAQAWTGAGTKGADM